MAIPKYIIQTSRKDVPPDYVVDMIKARSPGYIYKHYNDNEVITFFKENYLEEFPDVINKFFSFSYGEHRADLFRYYYLYVKGGVYFDTDAMIEGDLNEIVKDYSYFSVNSSYFPNSIFQGFIGCVPEHPIIYKGLQDIYKIQNEVLIAKPENFHDICRNMYQFVTQFKDQSKIKLFQEFYGGPEVAMVVDLDTNYIVLKHYHITKIIPPI